MTKEIEQVKQEIKMLQSKLSFLEELEKEPDMMLMRQGKVDIVDYDKKAYYRIEYTDSFSGSYVWFVRRRGEESIRQVRDVNIYGVLEDYYQKQVVKQKEEYPYKKQTPEEVAEGLRNAMIQAKKEGVFDEPKFTELPTLYEIIADWWVEIFVNNNPPGQNIESLVEQIEEDWLNVKPNEIGVYYGEGWQDCLEKLKLRLK
jgi:hypothetical protein